MLSTAVVTVALRGALSSRPRSPNQLTRPEAYHHLALTMHDDATVDHDVEGMRGRTFDDHVDAVRQRTDLRGGGELLDHEPRHTHGDRQVFDRRDPRRQGVGTLLAEDVESAQARQAPQRDDQGQRAEREEARRQASST